MLHLFPNAVHGEDLWPWEPKQIQGIFLKTKSCDFFGENPTMNATFEPYIPLRWLSQKAGFFFKTDVSHLLEKWGMIKGLNPWFLDE